jgi:hypothetical protein
MKICIFLFDDVGPALFIYADYMHGVAAYMSLKTGQRRDGDPSYHTNQVV